METIDRLSALSVDELRRIRATLRKRWGVGIRGNILEVAFGTAEKEGRIDPARPDAICFYVRHKRTPRSAADWIPERVDVRLKRGRKYVLVSLPADVLEVNPAAYRPTGRRIRHLSQTVYAMAGCVVAWRVTSRKQLHWGVLTVGHLFDHVRRVPQSTLRVLLEGHPPLKGRLLARSWKKDGRKMDASLVEFEKAALIQAGYLADNASTRGRIVRSVEQLSNDHGRIGKTLPYRQVTDFRVGRFMPETDLFRRTAGRLRHVIEVYAEPRKTFAAGTSGSLWVIDRQGACLQIGGWAPQFVRGVGQSLETIVNWARAAIADMHRVDNEDVDLRLIKEL